MPARTRPRHLAAAAFAAAGVLSCGASLRALYESDVRFEHCMALDARPDVKPTLRRACWEEWLSFYTFEQTRDRIDYAHLREKQLGAASDFDEGEVVRVAAAAPNPTSAIAPPPLTLAAGDGGIADAAVEVDEKAAALARCTSECQQALEACQKTCKSTPPCLKACAQREQRCAARCEPRHDGGPSKGPPNPPGQP